MRYRSDFRSAVVDILIITILTLALAAWLYPFIFVISSSISHPGALLQGRVRLFPVDLDFTAYRTVIAQPLMGKAFLNSVIYTTGRSVLALVLLAPLAYALSHKALKGKGILVGLLLVTMLFHAGIIPNFLTVQALGLIDTRWAMILPQLFQFWYVILLRTSFAGIPEDLKESAYLDGAEEWTVFTKIVLPLSKPILVTVGLFAAVAAWNDFFSALLYLQDRVYWPLTIILRNFVLSMSIPDIQGFGGQEMGLVIQAQMAIIVVSAIPMVALYPVLQRYFTKGIMIGAVKG